MVRNSITEYNLGIYLSEQYNYFIEGYITVNIFSQIHLIGRNILHEVSHIYIIHSENDT